MSEEEVLPIAQEALGAFEADEPPPNFAEAVVDASGEPRVGASRVRTSFSVGVVAAVAATLALALALALAPVLVRGDPEGAREASVRETVEIPQGRAVLEPGASIAWSGDTVQQASGEVFYRAEDPFTVQTAIGRVEVLGTCFSVEVVEMKHKKLAGAAAVAVGLLVVTVYEGHVLLANANGSQRASAGQQLVAEAGGAPRLASTHGPALAHALTEARRENGEQRSRIRDLERELAKREGAPQAGEARVDETPVERAQRCLSWGGAGCSFVDPEPEVLQELAKCGLAWVDQPGVVMPGGPTAPPPELIDAADLSADEIETMTALNEAFREQHDATLRGLYLDLGGAPGLVADLATEAVEGAIWALIPDDVSAEAIRNVSRERAGLEEPPAEIEDAAILYTRYNLDLGATYEAHLANGLGAERAHDIRLALDGWTGGKSTYGKCD